MSVILFLKSIVKKIPDKQTPERILVTVVKDYKKKEIIWHVLFIVAVLLKKVY